MPGQPVGRHRAEVARCEELGDHAHQWPAQRDRPEQHDTDGGVAEDAEGEEVARLPGEGGDGHRDGDGEQPAHRLLHALPAHQPQDEDQEAAADRRPDAGPQSVDRVGHDEGHRRAGLESTIPRQPPSCSSTRCRSNVNPDGAGRPARPALVVRGAHQRLPGVLFRVLSAGARRRPSGRRRSAATQLVPGVVDARACPPRRRTGRGRSPCGRARCPGCAAGPATPGSPSPEPSNSSASRVGTVSRGV